MKNKKNWALALILTAATGFAVAQSRITPETPATVTETPANAAPAYEGCALTWAYHDATNLTVKLDAMIRELNPKTISRASLYGEDCVYADGHSDFGAMETDFYVRLSVENLTDEESFGNWIGQIMPLIARIPREEIQGSYGFVEFWFEKNESEHVILRVPIQKYLDEAQGKSGVELYKFFSGASN